MKSRAQIDEPRRSEATSSKHKRAMLFISTEANIPLLGLEMLQQQVEKALREWSPLVGNLGMLTDRNTWMSDITNIDGLYQLMHTFVSVLPINKNNKVLLKVDILSHVLRQRFSVILENKTHAPF